MKGLEFENSTFRVKSQKHEKINFWMKRKGMTYNNPAKRVQG